MRQPDMSHSPAYYQDQQHQIVTAYLSDPENTPAAPSATRLPAESYVSRSQQPQHHDEQAGAAEFLASEPNSIHTSTRSYPSDPWDSYSQPNQHSNHPRHLPQQEYRVPVEPIYPDSAAVAPVTFVPSLYLENGSVLTWASYSNGAVRKEDRVRGSWTDHSSYMSGDNHTAGVARVHKRAIQDDDFPTAASQDALLMLFRMSLPIPLFSLCASLYTVFGLLFVVLVSPFRLCSCFSYLRNTSFRTQLCDLLVPQLHIHERLVGLREPSHRSSSTQTIHIDPDRSSSTNRYEGYSIGGLLTVLLLSSLFSFGLLLLAWTAAFFWVFAMILGNPDGTERKDDGRAAVLGVTRWWQIWLSKARKSPR